MLVFLTKDKKFKQKAIELSIKLQEDLENLKERTDAHNPQLILRKYKDIVAHEARSRQKCIMSVRQTLADNAKEEQTKIYNDPNLDEITRKLEGGILDNKRRDLENQIKNPEHETR